MKRKLAIITSHPIQYNAPLFAAMAKVREIDLMVFYTWGETALGPRYDPDFGIEIDWDIPLLKGYNYRFLRNTSKHPGSHHFNGIVNPTLNKEIENWGPDVIWVWGWSFNSHLRAMRYFKGKIPVWFRGDSTLLDEPKGFSLKKTIRRGYLKWVYKYVDKAFYVGTQNKNYFLVHGLKEIQLIKALHSIDNRRFSKSKDEYPILLKELRRKLEFHENNTVFLFSGKLEPKKNPFFILELAKYLKSSRYKFLIVGNGQLENELKKACVHDNRIKFLDFQNQTMMPVLYRLASFYVLPSKGPGETWGLSLNESLASGTPIIASNKCGGAIDLINNKCGFVLNMEKQDFVNLESWIKEFDIDEFISFKSVFLDCYNYKNIIDQLILNI